MNVGSSYEKGWDVPLSVLFWIADYLEEFLHLHGNESLIIQAFPGKKFKITRKENALSVEIPGRALVIERRRFLEMFRKAAVRLGRVHDYISLDQAEAAGRILEIRKIARQSLGPKTQNPPCRFLLRIDDFPAESAGSEKFLEAHQLFTEHHIPYLLAITPFMTRPKDSGFLTPQEIQILKKACSEGAQPALHGFTHEKHSSRPCSELAGMPLAEFKIWLTKAKGILAQHGIHCAAFVAPFNSYDLFIVPELLKHFSVICGGPESVHSLGYHTGPSFLGDCLYLPSYRGAYDIGSRDLPGLRELELKAAGLIIPITIHWRNGLKDGFGSFRQIARYLQGKVIGWDAYLQETRKTTAFLRSRLL